jgi:hypothetical protein
MRRAAAYARAPTIIIIIRIVVFMGASSFEEQK